MCEDLTPQELAVLPTDSVNLLTRRQVAALGASFALIGCSGSFAAQGAEALTEKTVSITTSDGVCDAFFVHPVKGTYPAVVMWPDVAGLREAKKIMARALAARGFAVLVVNPYYRSSPAPVLTSFSEFRTAEGQAKIAPMREALTPDAITRDAKALVAFLDGHASVDTSRGIGSSGYCMGGPFTVRTAAAMPSRVKAAVSFHGGGLATPAADSPHTLFAKTQASYLFAIARNDDVKQPEQKNLLRQASDAAQRPAQIEVYAADHGWCVPDSPAYDPSEAARAWENMLSVFQTL